MVEQHETISSRDRLDYSPGARAGQETERIAAFLYVMQADGMGTRIVADSLDLQGSPAWAPDGRSACACASDFAWPDSRCASERAAANSSFSASTCRICDAEVLSSRMLGPCAKCCAPTLRETRDKIEIEMDARHIVTHARAVTPLSQRVTLAAHRPPRGEGVKRSDPHPEEKAIVEAAPETALYVAALKQKSRKVVALALRQLLRLLREYPREPFLAAVQEAPGTGYTISTAWSK